MGSEAGRTSTQALSCLLRDQPEPSRKVAAAPERTAVADRGGQRDGLQHTDAGNGDETASRRILACHVCEFVGECGDPCIERTPLTEHVFDQL